MLSIEWDILKLKKKKIYIITQLQKRMKYYLTFKFS